MRKAVSFKRPLHCIVFGLGLLILSGCGTVAAHKQRLLAKPAMQFSDSSALSYDTRTHAQLEPGTAGAGGAGASGCASCR